MSSIKSSSKSSDGGSSMSLILGFSRSMEKASFGVLYAMIKGNTFPKVLTILSLLIEFCQLSSFGFKHQYPWGGDAGYYLKKIMSPVNSPSNVLGYIGFEILFWIVVGLLCLGFLNIWYVAYQFYRGKIANIWIIRTLRWFVSFSVAVLFIPIISLLLIGLDCTYDDGTAYLRDFDSMYCFKGTNLSIAVVSIILIILFSMVAFTSSATYYEYDTNIKSRFAKPHARFDVTILFVKFIFAFLNSLVNFVPWLTSIVFFVLMLVLTVGSIIILPYNNQRLNQVKSGFYVTVLFISLMTIITLAINDTTSPATCYITIVGVFAAFPIGYFLNRAYYKWLCSKISGIQILNQSVSMDRLNENKKAGKRSSFEQETNAPGSKVTWGKQPITLGSKRQIVFPFFAKRYVFSFFVEIMARTLLRESNEGVSTSSAESIERANNLYQCGLQYFPNSDILWMAYCNFLFTVRKDRHIGYAALEKLRRMKPSFDVRFFIYQRDKEREQIMDSDLRGPEHNGKIQDFVSYMEFKKLYYGAKRHHVKCLSYIKRFWGHLLHETVDLHRLSDLSGRIATTENKANESYERLLALNPNSVRVLRDYSQFLEEVVKDRDSSFRLQKKAEAIEEIMSKSQTSDFKINDIKTLDGDNSDNEVDQILNSEPNAIQLAKIDADIEKSHNSKSGGSQKSKDDSSESSSSSKGRKEKYREFQQSNAINKLSWLMIATTACCIIFLIVVLVVFRGLSVKHSNAYQGILSITDCATEAVTIGLNLSAMQAYALSGDTNSTRAEVERRRAQNDRSLIIMKNIHDSIYWGEGAPASYVGDNLSTLKSRNGYSVFDIGSVVFTYDQFNRSSSLLNNKKMIQIYNEPSVNMTILIAPTGTNQTVSQYYSQTYNAWKAGNTYIESAIIANQLSFETLRTNAGESQEFKFVILNAPIVMPDIFDKVQTAYIDSLVEDIMYTLNSIMYTWLGIFGFLVIIGVLLFRPIVTKIAREKIRTLVLFSLAPRDVVIRLSTKKIKMVSLDSGSERENLFDTTDDDDRDNHLNDDDEIPIGDKKKNDDSHTDPTGGSISSTHSGTKSDNENDDGQTVMVINENNNNNSPMPQFRDRRPLMDSTSVINSTTSNRSRVHIEQPIDSTTITKERKDSDAIRAALAASPKYGWDGVSKRNLNKKSLRSILNRLHWSYVVAIFLLFGFITMGIWVSFTVIFNNSEFGYTLAQSCTRALDARVINYFVAEIYTFDDDTNPQDMVDAIAELQKNHQALPYIDEVRPLMEGEYGCWALDKSHCFNSSSPYYYDVSEGLDWVIDTFSKAAISLAFTNKSVLYDSKDLAWFLAVGADYTYQGLDTATFLYYNKYQDLINWATTVLTAILAVSCVILLLVHVILFRPFMNHLRIQHIHTLALLRLAPDDIRFMEVSDKVIDED